MPEVLTPTALRKRRSVTLGLRVMTMARKSYATNPDNLYRGLRAVIGPLTVTGISHYIRYQRMRECETVFYRHQFRNQYGKLFVYTGVRLNVKVDDIVYLRCTIKAVDNVWNCIRVMRPVVMIDVEPVLF